MINLTRNRIVTITGAVGSSGNAWFIKSGVDPIYIDSVSNTPLVLGPYISDAFIDIRMIDGTYTSTYTGEGDQVPTSTASQINTKAASYTLTLSDISKLIRMNSGSAQTLTIPPNFLVPFPIGTEIAVEQSGVGALTIVAGSGVTINSAATLVLNGQYATAALKKIAVDTWLLAGRLV